MKDISATVIQIESLNSTVFKVDLEVQDTQFMAGQYLMIALPSGEKVPYSIGSSPHELPSLTLYISAPNKTSLAFKVIEYLQQNHSVTLSIPGGDAHINKAQLSESSPLLLIAGGTGFAQMKSIYDDLLYRQHSGSVHFYWGLRSLDDVFAMDWINHHNAPENFHIQVVVNEGGSGWHGRTGWLYDAIIEDHLDLSTCQTFISGSAPMVYGTLEQLEAHGIKEDNCHSDVFAYAPRPQRS